MIQKYLNWSIFDISDNLTMSMERNMVSVDSLGLMVALIPANLKKTISKVMELTIGPMVVSS